MPQAAQPRSLPPPFAFSARSAQAAAAFGTSFSAMLSAAGTASAAAASPVVVVLAGHGEFNRVLAPKTFFVVPEKVTIVLYTPPGAALNNPVGLAIERGDFPVKSQLVLRTLTKPAEAVALADGKAYQALPGYPYLYTQGMKCIDFTLLPPDRLPGADAKAATPAKVVRLPKKTKKTLETLAKEELAAAGGAPVVLHWAACVSLHLPSDDPLAAHFPGKGHYVDFPDFSK